MQPFGQYSVSSYCCVGATCLLTSKALQSSAAPLRHRIYHLTAGRPQNRIARSPFFRGKVKAMSASHIRAESSGVAAVESDEWTSRLPADVGLDPVPLQELTERIRSSM